MLTANKFSNRAHSFPLYDSLERFRPSKFKVRSSSQLGTFRWARWSLFCAPWANDESITLTFSNTWNDKEKKLKGKTRCYSLCTLSSKASIVAFISACARDHATQAEESVMKWWPVTEHAGTEPCFEIWGTNDIFRGERFLLFLYV